MDVNLARMPFAALAQLAQEANEKLKLAHEQERRDEEVLEESREQSRQQERRVRELEDAVREAIREGRWRK